MKAIVLGATGLVGGAIFRRLKFEDGNIIFTLPRVDLRYVSGFLKLDLQADVIFHAVECVKNISAQGIPDFDQVLNNALVDIKVIKEWKKYQPQARLVAFSSLWAYPADGSVFGPEDYDTGKPGSKVRQYAAAKRSLIENLAGLNAAVLALPNVYGPGDRSSRIVPTVLKIMLRGEDLSLRTNGVERRDFAHVDDVAKVTIDYARLKGNGVFHVGGRSHSIRELVETASRVVGYRGAVTFGAATAPSRSLSPSYPQREFMSLEDGLAQTVLAMRASGDIVGVASNV